MEKAVDLVARELMELASQGQYLIFN